MSKRQANTPVSGVEKRKEVGSPNAISTRIGELTRKLDDELTINLEGANKPEQNSSRRNSNSRSYASIAMGETRAEAYRRKRDSAKSLYVTPKPQGGYKDELIIKALTINGYPFKGTFTSDEVISIFVNILGFEKKLLHAYKAEWRNGQMTLFLKMKQQTNIDDLWECENFTYTRKVPRGKEILEDKIECQILGIRKRPGMQGDWDEQEETGIRWIKVEGAEYRLEKREIVDWLSTWGEPLSDPKEDVHEDTIDPDSDSEPISTGLYSLKMKLNELPPQHIPMCGRRVRLYYKGIVKKCGKCFGDHKPNVCDQERVPWINYVRDFMEDFPEIDESYYGRWTRILNEEEAAGKMANTPRVWTRRSLNGETIKPLEAAAVLNEEEETSEDESDSSTHVEDITELSTNQEIPSITKEQLIHLKRDCKSAGVDAAPALELLDNSLFGQGKRVPRTKKPRAFTANAADEDECIKKIDQARKMTVPNTTTTQYIETGNESTKTKKAIGGKIKAKNNH
jgi:hypothetical protein